MATGVAALAVSAGVGYSLWRLRQHISQQDRGWRLEAAAPGAAARPRRVRVRVLYGSMTGESKRWAQYLVEEVSRRKHEQHSDTCLEVCIEDLATFVFDDLLVAPKRDSEAVTDVVVVLLSTHTGGAAPPHCAHFCTLLEDHVHDFRVSQAALAHLSFAVLGFGSVEYEPTGHFCTAAAQVDASFSALAARRLLPLVRVTDTEDTISQVEPWIQKLLSLLQDVALGNAPPAVPSPDSSRAAAGSNGAADEADESSDSESDADSIGGGKDNEAAADDVEELAEGCSGDAATNGTAKAQPVREMLTSKHRAQLTKEGYKLIGSHSAVKLCRWTKHQLRGRGGCYKHSFYGITSYQCMEATPSLACANKCVFCWRHHKNPVGTEWKWRMDDPDMIVSEGIEQHRRMIKECRGIPGVKTERFEEAMQVRHCALSLVGEPIMYPRINELLGELHKRRISTFLVTNAQFPDAIRQLTPITQLYVSVDAGTPEVLKAVDRPLFADFWERYIASLQALGEKKQRTVYRLTLVKDQNMVQAPDYARLVALGQPDFIEIKSVTFCGESKASSLTMQHVPWHEEIKRFSEAMLSHEGLSADYELACEHQHSCIVLIAHRRYKIDGRWHTWINYDRFHDLVTEGRGFEAMDYTAPTPDWALYGSDEAGFDPHEKRTFHNRTKRRAKAGLLSEEQLRQYPHNPALDD